ncbi:MAG: MaoC family dehydratase [Acidimicrobiales bacterium]
MTPEADLRPGTALAPLTRTIELPDMVAYAGATWDWYRAHYDTAFAASQHLAGPLVDGQMLGALLAESVQDALGPRARLRRLAFRFKAMVVAGDTVTCTGTVETAVPGPGGLLVELVHEIRCGERVVVAPASSTVLVVDR